MLAGMRPPSFIRVASAASESPSPCSSGGRSTLKRSGASLIRYSSSHVSAAGSPLVVLRVDSECSAKISGSQRSAPRAAALGELSTRCRVGDAPLPPRGSSGGRGTLETSASISPAAALRPPALTAGKGATARADRRGEGANCSEPAAARRACASCCEAC
eukprot:scaffold91333_cov23-Tisochrysis_lutea.AAC.3